MCLQDVKQPCAVRLCRLTRNGGAGRGVRHSPHQMALVACPYAFRLCRLAQTSGKRHFSNKFSHQIALLTCPCACRLRRLAENEKSHTKKLAKRPPLVSLCRDLAKRPLMEILFRDLAKRPLVEICTERESSYRDLVQRSCQETSCRDLYTERALIEILFRDLARRPLIEILYRDLVKRAAILLGDL